MAKNSDSISVNEKDEVISRLYSLRAGLSVIAQEREKADKIMNDARRAKQNAIDAADERIENAKRKVAGKHSDLNKISKQIEKLQPMARSAGPAVRLIVYALLTIPVLACVYLFVDGGARFVLSIMDVKTLPGFWGMFLLWGKPAWESGWLKLPYLIAVILGFMGTGGLITLMCGLFGCSLKKRKQAQHEISELKSGISAQNSKISDARSSVEKAREQKERDIAAADANIAKAQKEATEHAVAGLALIDALDDAYSDMIDVRDWQNVDIIIYALETRRAENMKEALVVVDGERRTERLEMAITDAGNAICQSINTGLRRLQGEMTRCFGILGQIIVAQTDRIAAGMQSLGAGIAANNSYLSSLTTQASMNNALLAKANENSTALAENVTRLRTAVEYSEARKMYN